MGTFFGGGGWIGPGSRYANWMNRRWWHFYVHLGVTTALLMFPVQYFGLVTNRSEGQLLSSLVGAMFFGAFFGLAMFAFAAWARRKMDEEEG